MLSSLRLMNFRCFPQLKVDLSGGTTVFIGENAQGKTSILEAVCVLLRLHSPRTHRMGRMVRMGEAGFGVAGRVGDSDLQVRHQPGRGGGTLLACDGVDVPTSRDYLSGGELIVWMGNEDLELVRGPAEARRHYLDFICGQLDARYRRALSRYRRAVKARNFLLKKVRPDEGEIAAYTSLLIEEGAMIQEVRHEVAEGLVAPARDSQKAVSGRDEALQLSYRPSGSLRLPEAFEQAREAELRQRQTVVGPHRDELLIEINGMSAADYASEGQQRTAALALKLAQGALLESRGGRLPLYLLDDIFGELDASRRNALLTHLPRSSQKLITTTSLDWLRELDGVDRFRVRDATVSRER